MREYARLPGILLLAVVLAGCSSFSRYVISNNSDGIAVIAYSYPAYISGNDKRSTCPLRPVADLPATTLDKLSNNAIAWQRLALDKFIFNDRECSIRVAIIAGASLTFAARYPLRKRPRATALVDADLIQLNIENESNNVVLKGVRKFQRFERQGEKLYVYDFP